MSSFTSFSETTLALQKSRLHPLSAFASCLPMAGQEGLAAWNPQGAARKSPFLWLSTQRDPTTGLSWRQPVGTMGRDNERDSKFRSQQGARSRRSG